MSIAHKWLEQEPWPTQVMPKKLLESRIERVLTLTNIGYLGTVKKDGSPIVSPVEFYNDGFNLYIFPQPNSPKVHALRRDPRAELRHRQPDGRLGLRHGRAVLRQGHAARRRTLPSGSTA